MPRHRTRPRVRAIRTASGRPWAALLLHSSSCHCHSPLTWRGRARTPTASHSRRASPPRPWTPWWPLSRMSMHLQRLLPRQPPKPVQCLLRHSGGFARPLVAVELVLLAVPFSSLLRLALLPNTAISMALAAVPGACGGSKTHCPTCTYDTCRIIVSPNKSLKCSGCGNGDAHVQRTRAHNCHPTRRASGNLTH